MKKMLSGVGVLLILVSSCKKEDLNAWNKNSESYRYYTKTKVFDGSGKYYLEFIIKTNDEFEYTENVNFLNNSILNFENHSEKKDEQEVSNSILESKLDFEPTNTQGTTIVLSKIDIGNNKIVSLKPKHDYRVDHNFGFTYRDKLRFDSRVYGIDVYQMKVQATTGDCVAFDHSIDGSIIYVTNWANISWGQTHTFPTTGYLQHIVEVIPVGYPLTHYCVITIVQ